MQLSELWGGFSGPVDPTFIIFSTLVETEPVKRRRFFYPVHVIIMFKFMFMLMVGLADTYCSKDFNPPNIFDW